MSRLSLDLLGGMRVVLHDRPVTAFESNRVRALLAYLAVEHNRTHQRSALAGLLWPDLPETQARTNLRHVLRQLRLSLNDHAATPPLIAADQQTIAFTITAADRCDLAQVQALLAASERCTHPAFAVCADCIARYAEAAELYRGPLLAGFDLDDSDLFAEWLALRREHIQHQALAVWAALATLYEQRNEPERAEPYVRRQLEWEPWREEAHRQLMRLFAQRGQRTAALAHYAHCRAILADELGVAPDAATEELAAQIRAGSYGRPARAGNAPGAPPTPARIHDWGEAPAQVAFFGRQAELAMLERWFVGERRRVVLVLSMGGMGKTALVTQAARALAQHFDVVIWRSLRNAPPLGEVLAECVRICAPEASSSWPESPAEQVQRFLHALRLRRCLVVFDNLETILADGQAGQYRPGYADYAELIARMAQSEHQSSLALTSRERPQGVLRLEEDTGQVRTLALGGLATPAAQSLLHTRGLADHQAAAAEVVRRYSGNPLALKLVARTIQELFDGDIAAFLSDETLIFDDIRTVLDQQFARLTALEREIMFWLAIEREAISLQTLLENLVHAPVRRDLVEALRALQRRSLIEKTSTGFTLQNVVLEYLTDVLVARAYAELAGGTVDLLQRHALLKAQARQYVRQSQRRLILQPLAQRLIGAFGPVKLAAMLHALLARLRSEAPGAPGYAGGNLLNLLLYLGIDARGYDFSALSVWQADLRDARLPDVDLTGADLRGCAFTGTFGLIYALAFSPDGQQLAVGTGDGRVYLWRMSDHQPAAVLHGHRSIVQSVAFSPDGRWLASGSDDRLICVWDVYTTRRQLTLHGHSDWVAAVAFSPDNRTLASGSYDRTVRLWDLHDGSARQILHGHNAWITAVVFSPDGASLASSSADGTIRLWDRAGQPIAVTNAGHTDAIASLTFCAEGKLLISGGADQTVRIWEVTRAVVQHTLNGHSGAVHAVVCAPDNTLLVSGGTDRTIRAWDPRTGQIRHTLIGHTNDVRALALSPDGRILASGSADQSVRLWDLASGQALQTLQGYLNAVWAVAFAPQAADGHVLASSGDDQQIRIWDLRTGQVRQTLQGHVDDVCSVIYSPDGRTLASGGADQTVRLWDSASGALRETLHGHNDGVWSVAYSPDGALLASGSEDRTIVLWATDTRQLRNTLYGHTGAVRSVAFSPDGRTLASGSADQTVRLWDVARGTPLHTLGGHTRWVRAVAFSPDGTLLVSAGADRTLRVWNVANGMLCRVLHGHEDIIIEVAFSPDGVTVASGSSDRTVRLWDVRNGQLLHTMHGHTLWVRAVAFSPDGRRLASGSADETVKLWDVAGGDCIQTLRAAGPYAGTKIANVTGITGAQRAALRALGAVE
jgi:WD40 repeat protein/DNA-binding SARP family transcriptional activator